MKQPEFELDFSYLNNWESLNARDNPVKQAIIRDWNELLATNQKEQIYHKFLADHSGFFFHEGYPDSIIISKMKFGADFVSDFVVCYDKGSDGFQYELIELEKPTSLLFTKYDKIASGLNSAIQQVQSWRMWLLSHIGSIKNIFPSSRYNIDGFLNLKYTIIIGKTEAMSEYQIKQRNFLASNLGISIRSFNYLTSLLKKSVFLNTVEFINDTEKKAEPFSSQFANPFYRAYDDHQWRKMIRTKGFSNYDMIASNVGSLIENRTYNTNRLKEFQDYQSTMIK